MYCNRNLSNLFGRTWIILTIDKYFKINFIIRASRTSLHHVFQTQILLLWYTCVWNRLPRNRIPPSWHSTRFKMLLQIKIILFLRIIFQFGAFCHISANGLYVDVLHASGMSQTLSKIAWWGRGRILGMSKRITFELLDRWPRERETRRTTILIWSSP